MRKLLIAKPADLAKMLEAAEQENAILKAELARVQVVLEAKTKVIRDLRAALAARGEKP